MSIQGNIFYLYKKTKLGRRPALSADPPETKLDAIVIRLKTIYADLSFELLLLYGTKLHICHHLFISKFKLHVNDIVNEE